MEEYINWLKNIISEIENDEEFQFTGSTNPYDECYIQQRAALDAYKECLEKAQTVA